ncbi:hypothetical protein E4U41_003390, partial [Claviceps citrina]
MEAPDTLARDAPRQLRTSGTGAKGRAMGDGGGAESSPPRARTVITSSVVAAAAAGKTTVGKLKHACWTFGKFVGPGFMISVAY